MKQTGWKPWAVLVLVSTSLSAVTWFTALNAVKPAVLAALAQAPDTELPAAVAAVEATGAGAPSAPADEKQPAKRTGPGVKEPVDGRYPPVLDSTTEYVVPSAKQQRWALASCAVLTTANGERHDSLAGCDETDENRAMAARVLKGAWGIENRSDLLDTLEWIETTGHRSEFDAAVSFLAEAPDEKVDDLTAKDPALAEKFRIAAEKGDPLGAGGVAAWDYGRYVFLCRRGYLLGYLTEDEAWERIMPAARALQGSYGSWAELGDGYLTGRAFWSAEKPDPVMERAYRELLDDAGSPWKQLPWDLDLSAKGA